MPEASIWSTGIQGPPGPPGQPAILRLFAGWLQWSVQGTDVWTNLVEITELTGPQGPPGQSIQGPPGPPGVSFQGAPGPQGIPGIQGVQGYSVLSSTGTPSDLLGVNGDWCVDVVNALFYGPKAGGTWGVSAIDLKAGLASTISPAAAFTGVIGVSSLAARQDHVHPFPTVAFEDFAPATGATITIANATSTAIIAPAATIATLTVNLPAAANAYNGQVVELFVQGFGVTTSTIQSTGSTMRGAPTTLSANTGYRFKYRTSNTTWYRIG